MILKKKRGFSQNTETTSGLEDSDKRIANSGLGVDFHMQLLGKGHLFQSIPTAKTSSNFSITVGRK